MTGALPTYGQEEFPEGLGRGFAEGMVKYGMPMKTLQMIPVNGFAYAQQVMIGQPDDSSGGPPPAWMLWLMTRLHPAFRERNRNALNALKNRQWEIDLAEWDDFYREDSIRRNLELVEVDLPSLSDEAFIDHFNKARDNMVEMYYRHHKWSVSAIYPMGVYLHKATSTGKIAANEAIALLKGSTPVSTGAFRPQLLALRGALEAAGKNVADLEAISADDFVEAVRNINDDIRNAFNEYYKHVSQMLVSGYMVTEQTVAETPNILKTRVINAMQDNLEDRSIPEETKAQEAEIRARLSGEELAEFDEWLANVRNINRLRDERGVYNDIWGAGIGRVAVLEAGRRLVEKGVLDDSGLAVDASHTELLGLLKGDNAVSLEELKSRRDWRLAARIEDAPDFLGDPPDEEPPPLHLFPKGLALSTAAMITAFMSVDDNEEAEPAEAGTLNGIAVSPGVYEGTARIISGPEDFARLEPGDVLVTKNTSAAFNVVLPILGALVTDRGGLLSHAAIVSREYGIPGVVATKKATREIEDGARIKVDGTAGSVSVVA
jgi:pyruvate,water dikinase